MFESGKAALSNNLPNTISTKPIKFLSFVEVFEAQYRFCFNGFEK